MMGLYPKWLIRMARRVDELAYCRMLADELDIREKFEDVFVLGNTCMLERPGLPYEPMDIIQTLVKYDS